MSRYFFDIHDGYDFARDEDGIQCETLKDLSYQAVDVLPDIVREELPDGPSRTFSVKARDGTGAYVFRATLTLASAWIVETIGDEQQPGGDRWGLPSHERKSRSTHCAENLRRTAFHSSWKRWTVFFLLQTLRLTDFWRGACQGKKVEEQHSAQQTGARSQPQISLSFSARRSRRSLAVFASRFCRSASTTSFDSRSARASFSRSTSRRQVTSLGLTAKKSLIW